MEPAVEPRAFTVGVVAPPGYDLPDLDRRVWARLYPLIAPRLSKREAVRFHAVAGEPVSQVVGEISRGKGWGSVPGHCGRWDRGRQVAHRSACAHVALVADAMVLFHTAPLDRDMKAVLWWCDWLRLPHRVIRLDPDPEPL